MLRSSLCDYNDAYKLATGTIPVVAQPGDNSKNANKNQYFKNCAPFTDYISK